ncbi:hypothetical protein BDV95DRAFT_147432 [Massariosphaeria phaeospora]|uniref:Zn(2)-C6 fungal-type domain-containing protein n=1 Tax=Massariosphaeria phaeospora TaxID=100035 RepID=A0A7C8IH23_9PLEO|nr:hypothetical protein BDV95DRAFT_147432 [Massariosphaeria phaeospora]
MDSPATSSSAAVLSTPDVFTSYDECLASYRQFLKILNLGTWRAVKLKEVEISKALEGYGRLRTWGEETRASLPATLRGSLDHTLRKNEALKNTAVRIVEKLRRQLEFATRIAGVPLKETEASPAQDGDAEEEEESESSSEDDEDEGGTRRAATLPKLSVVLRCMGDDIKSLQQLSLLLSRPGFSRQYLHSTGKNDVYPEIAHFADFDRRHLEEKLQEWENQHKKVEEKEPVTTPGMIEDRIATKNASPNNKRLLGERLARANTKRRDQLLHWSRHPEKLHKTTPALDRVADSMAIVIPSSRSEGLPARPHVRADPKLDTESQGHKSAWTKKTFSTVVVSDHLGPQTTIGPARTIYAESTVGNKRSNRVPDVPREAKTAPTFECPHCHTTLSSETMNNRVEWKRHVFRDLRPYICTFQDCHNPDKQYLTRHDWMYHEKQMHRRQWVCEEHEQTFATSDMFLEHVSDWHTVFRSKEQEAVLLEISERQLDEMEIVACPLCPDERRLMALERHLAEHLESISLFVLPTHVEDDRDNTDSKGAAGGASSSRVSETNSSKSWSKGSMPAPQDKGSDSGSSSTTPPSIIQANPSSATEELSNLDSDPDTIGRLLFCPSCAREWFVEDVNWKCPYCDQAGNPSMVSIETGRRALVLVARIKSAPIPEHGFDPDMLNIRQIILLAEKYLIQLLWKTHSQYFNLSAFKGLMADLSVSVWKSVRIEGSWKPMEDRLSSRMGMKHALYLTALGDTERVLGDILSHDGVSCGTCRRRKKKCDRAKPACNNCTRGGFVCEGYAINTAPQPESPVAPEAVSVTSAAEHIEPPLSRLPSDEQTPANEAEDKINVSSARPKEPSPPFLVEENHTSEVELLGRELALNVNLLESIFSSTIPELAPDDAMLSTEAGTSTSKATDREDGLDVQLDTGRSRTYVY